MKKSIFLLPVNLRFVGFFFVFCGLILGIARFYYGIKPDLLDLKTFAFYSSYLESRYMEIVRNNMAEELTGILLTLGLFFIAFSREKEELEEFDQLRLKSFFLAAYLNLLFLLLALLFTFGLGFVYMLMVNVIFGLVSYILVFRFLVFRNQKIKTDHPE